MASARESRRKRIAERGSDRLAFITGQSSSLPPPQPDFPQSPPPPLPATNNVATTHDEDAAAGNILDTCGNVTRSISSSVQASSNAAISSSIQTSSNSAVITEPQPAPQPNTRIPIFTPGQIISAISASENIRLICSASIAFLVVLSYSLYPQGLISMIAYRPIYLVLVTDVTIMLGLLMANKGSSSKAEAEARNATINTDDWADNVGKALELGLVLQNVLSALFMDCSVCAVLLISGLSLLRLG